MGSISSYETSEGKRYKVRYRDPDRKSREKNGFKRKKDAEDYLATVTVASLRGEYVDPGSAKVTIHELGVQWIANQTQLKPSSLSVLESSWRVHVDPEWGHRRIGEIRHSEVRAWVTKMAAAGGKPRSASVTIRAFGILAGILDVAVRDRRITMNPARGVKLPRKKKKRRAYLSAAQVELLAGKAGEHGTLVYTLAYTGLRWGEVTAIRLSALDMLRRRILVQENAVRVHGHIIVGTPKTHENRSVPYPKFLSELLARACEGKRRDQLVFGNGDAHVVTPTSRDGWFRGAVVKSQRVDPTFPSITPHDLRHTAASLAIHAGANPKAVQRMLGHASAAMTLDTYADLFEDDLDAVSERLDAVRAETVVGFSWGSAPATSKIAP